MFEMMRKCLDWRPLAVVAVVLVGLAVVSPSLLWAAVPLLLIAACPLMLAAMGVGGIVMARKRRDGHRHGEPVDGHTPVESHA